MYMMSEARHVNGMARSVFEKDGCHRPMMLVFHEGERVPYVLDAAPFMQSPEGKELLSAIVKRMARKNVITAVVFITEAWMASVEQGNPDAERMMRGDVSVSDRPDKVEVLMVTAESDDGLDVVFMNEIARDAAGKPTLKEPKELKGCVGRFGGFFAQTGT